MEEQLIPIQWKDDALVLLDQTLLPNEVVYESFKTAESVWDAIQVMKVRGAPAIGVFGSVWCVFRNTRKLFKVRWKTL